MTGPKGGRPAPAGEAAAPGHPTSSLDDTVHQRHRLGILTITAEARAEFGYLRDPLAAELATLTELVRRHVPS